MMQQQATPALAGRRVLIAEDEWLIAADFADMLQRLGAEVLGPVPTIAEALALLAREARIDAALLDVNLRGTMIWPVVEALQARGVPIVLSSGYDSGAIPPAYQGLPRCEKPSGRREIGRALARLLEGR